MQIEQAFVLCDSSEIVSKTIHDIITAEDGEPEIQMETPNCFDESLINDKKRKIGISSAIDGWINILEKSEFNDYGMLMLLSERLKTTVLAVSYSEIIWGWGWTEFRNGSTVGSFFIDDEDSEWTEELDLMESLKAKLMEYGISKFEFSFSHVAKSKNKEWIFIKK